MFSIPRSACWGLDPLSILGFHFVSSTVPLLLDFHSRTSIHDSPANEYGLARGIEHPKSCLQSFSVPSAQCAPE